MMNARQFINAFIPEGEEVSEVLIQAMEKSHKEFASQAIDEAANRAEAYTKPTVNESILSVKELLK